MKLDTIVIQVDGNNVQAYYGSNARAILGLPRTFNVDTTKFSDGWHELRARCYGMETTAGPELGKQTQVTNGHQLYFKNGNAFIDNRSVTPGIVDTHSHLGVYAAPGVEASSDGNEATNPTTPYVWAEHSVWPQDPQLVLSVLLTHAPPHGICPDGQEQVPSLQVPPLGHAVPQVPQFIGSVLWFEQNDIVWVASGGQPTCG